MGIQSNFNNGLFQLAALTTLASINQSINRLGFNSIDDLTSKIRDIEIQIASLKDQGVEPTELEELKNNYQAVVQKYYEESKKEAEKRKEKNMIWGFITFVILAIFMCIMFSYIDYTEKAYDAEHAYGKYRCTRCGGYKTHGFYTFSYNSGMLCTGNKEYCLAHADYSIFSCDHCGNNFKVTREQWQNK